MKEILALNPSATADLAPPRISEIVLKTSRFDVMRDWYQLVLSATRTFEYDVPGQKPHGEDRAVNFHRLCFLRIFWQFPYTEVLALFEIPDLRNVERSTGLHHMQFRLASLDALADRHERLSRFGIEPYKSYNHGPSTSLYYEDPDANLVELSGPNFESEDDYKAFFSSPGFAKNPAGVPIDLAAFIAALRSGADRRELVRLPS
jgi:hypothetical protein